MNHEFGTSSWGFTRCFPLGITIRAITQVHRSNFHHSWIENCDRRWSISKPLLVSLKKTSLATCSASNGFTLQRWKREIDSSALVRLEECPVESSNRSQSHGLVDCKCCLQLWFRWRDLTVNFGFDCRFYSWNSADYLTAYKSRVRIRILPIGSTCTHCFVPRFEVCSFGSS